MKKFSSIEKIDLRDNEPKTFNESASALFDELVTVKMIGENAELSGKMDITIDGKERFISLVEKLAKVYVLKERSKLLENFKIKAYQTKSFEWVDNDINQINQMLEKYINGEIVLEDLTFSKNEILINEGKKKCQWSSKFFEDNEQDSDEFLKSFQYFVDTYINGNFSQLKTMLKSIMKEKKIGALKSYLKECGCENADDIKDWVLDQIDED